MAVGREKGESMSGFLIILLTEIRAGIYFTFLKFTLESHWSLITIEIT